MQLKLDELIRASGGARNRLLTLEDLTEAELDQVKASFAKIAARDGIGKGAVEKVVADLDDAEEEIEKARTKAPARKARRRPASRQAVALPARGK